MTTAIDLPRDRLEPLVPREETDTGWNRISAYGIPRQVKFAMRTDNRKGLLAFSYFGDPKGTEQVSLEPPSAPPVYVIQAANHGPILEIWFDHHVPRTAEELGSVADRLDSHSARLVRLGERFNYQMVANVLRTWAADVIKGLAEATS
jgi:hypothetical protein